MTFVTADLAQGRPPPPNRYVVAVDNRLWLLATMPLWEAFVYGLAASWGEGRNQYFSSGVS